MSKSQPSEITSERSYHTLVKKVLTSIDADKPVRQDLEDGGRLHVDRALPFLCVHITEGKAQLAAQQIVAANASYLITSDLELATTLAEAIGASMTKRFGAFLLLDIAELEHDRFLTDDAPYLPSFEITLSTKKQRSAVAALSAFAKAVEAVEARYRSPLLKRLTSISDPHAELCRRVSTLACLTVRLAPIYRRSGSSDVYPELLQRVVASLFDAGLQAITAFLKASGTWHHPTHRALGRKVFIDIVSRADQSIDDIAGAFDFLLAVSPINPDTAWEEFRSNGFNVAPKLFYRPLTVHVDDEKRKLYSLPFDHFEDPVLIRLYREKQQELDLQLSMLLARETPRFLQIGRALYGSVEPALLLAAKDILQATAIPSVGADQEAHTARVDCYFLERAARSMIAAYRAQNRNFSADVEIRDDLLPGMMVLKDRLLISRRTTAARDRVDALLSHEIGVHILTYFNGSHQGLRLFRLGLSGYENAQEGLAVFAEFLVGGLTIARLRLLAARVFGCAMMLDGASFSETFLMLVREHGLSRLAAFHSVLRLYRGGGLPKDAVYLRGVLEILDHLRNGGSLEPFWTGKISAASFGVVQELGLRELLKPPAVRPVFLSHPEAARRLELARSGLSVVDLIAK